MSSGSSDVEREESINAILLDFVEAVERGENPNRGTLLQRYPEFADDLASYFATRDQLDHLAAPLRTISGTGRAASHPCVADGPAEQQSAMTLTADVGRIGDFRLLREVGRGGMGVVYEAEQVSLRRRVALKVLPFAAAVDPRHLQRFRNEAQAAAQLHHNNIVPVYAVGAEAGVHYYAMQYIDGQSLAQLLNELRDPRRRLGTGSRPPSVGLGAAQTPEPAAAESRTPKTAEPAASSVAISTEHTTRRRDYYRRAAELIRQVADALEYAHQAGIIHRDIKPANLLLDAAGRLWVTDFGLALIRNDSGLTAPGELVGTFRYMSPEQASGKGGLVDHRTDIYSLGVTLYELLTLTPAFDGDDRHILLRQLAEEEPRPPRAIDRGIPGELETIVLKAIAKHPGDRYASARELAEDLQRFLDVRPILARRPTLADRIAKWGRRHRAAALTAFLALALASLGLAVATTMIAREHAETKAAYERERNANARERDRAREAEDHYSRTRRAVDLFVELSDEGLLDFPPLISLRQRLLEAAVAYYQELNDRRDDAGVQKDLEASRDRLARLQAELIAINEINTTLLLDQAVVRTHLQVTPEQLDRLAPMLDLLKTHQPVPFPEPALDKRQQIADLAAKCREDVERILTAAQYRQLRQVYLQLPGPHVFGADVLSALGLTDTQKGHVRRIQAEATQASLKLIASSIQRELAMAKVADVWKQANVAIVQILTPVQQKRWNEMTGPQVQGELRFPIPLPGQSQ